MDKKKKVAFLIYSLTAGGAERACCTTANFLAQRGYDVSIYLLCNDKTTIYEIDPKVKIYGTPPLRFGYRISVYLIYLEWMLLRKVPDVLISYMWAANFFAAWMSRIFHIKTILAERSNPEFAEKFYLSGTLERAEKLLPYAAKIVVLDDKIGEYMAEKYKIDRNKFVTIFNFKEFSSNRNVTGAADFPRPYLLAVGRLCYAKGYERMFRIFAEVVKVIPEIHLVVCGEGELRNLLEDLIRQLHLEDKIYLAGLKKDMIPIYSNAEAVLFTSHYEGLPNVLLESMVWGNCPAISFDVKYGPSNIIINGVNGLLVPQDDEKAFAEALIKYLRDPGMRAEFVRNIPESMKKFSPEVIVDQWEKLIDDVTAERG